MDAYDEISKELKERKRILKIYNKQRIDFATKEEWDNYLEEVEDIILNLVNRIDVKETEARVSEYQRVNRLNIIANQARAAEEARQANKQAAAAFEESTAAAAAGPAPSTATFQPPTLLAAQPMPVSAAAMDSEGNLPRPSLRAQDAVAAASGWSPELPRARALQEAFSSLLVF